jgi:hypothetical protein
MWTVSVAVQLHCKMLEHYIKLQVNLLNSSYIPITSEGQNADNLYVMIKCHSFVGT